MVRTKEEINNMREAIRITDEIYLKIREFVKPGKTEKEVYDFILEEIKKSDADTYSFEPIVASGPNGAEPHHKASEYEIKNGEMIVIDFGVFYNGIASDMTRMIGVGELTEFQYKIYEIVKEAMTTAISKIKAGVKISDIDIAARDVIQWNGYYENFIHTTGHGLGREVHEEPNVFFKTEGVLKENEVITVEPGIYLKDKLGVRLEQDILVKKDGFEILNKSSLDL